MKKIKNYIKITIAGITKERQFQHNHYIKIELVDQVAT